jgi:hypothetical protein
MTATDLAREVSAILGREVSGTQTKNGISLRVGTHQLFISRGNPVCPKACAAVFELGDAYDRVLEEDVPERLTELVERLK